MLVARHDAVVKDDQAAAAPEELLEVRALGTLDLHAVGREDHEDVRLLQLGRGRELHGPVGLDAAVGEEFGVFAEKPGMVVLVGAVGLDARPDEDPERIAGLTGPDEQQGKNDAERAEARDHNSR